MIHDRPHTPGIVIEPAAASHLSLTRSADPGGPTEIKHILPNQADRVWNSGAPVLEAAGTKEAVIPLKAGIRGQLSERSAKLQSCAPNKVESEPVKISADRQEK